MTSSKYDLLVLPSSRDLLSVEEAASRAGLHPEIVLRFIRYGLIEPADEPAAEILLDAKAVHRIRIIQRLRCDLGVNLAGAGVILELLDRLNCRHGL
jgi:DNA-binding transcriptional MerR regulator